MWRSIPIQVLLILVISQHVIGRQLVDLHYALFTWNISPQDQDPGATAAAELAEEHILNDRHILPGYRLTHGPPQDTMCDRATALQAFFQTVVPSNPPPLALIDASCSVASTAIAELVPFYNISQIATFSTSYVLSDRTRFRNFFRTSISDVSFVPAVSSVIQHYGWKRVAVITQEDVQFLVEIFELLQVDLEAAGVTVGSVGVSGNSSSDVKSVSLTRLFDSNRVFFLNVYSSVASKVICEAYRRNMFSSNYVWLVYGWYPYQWWLQSSEGVQCTTSELEEFITTSRPLAVDILPVPSDLNATTDLGITSTDFYLLYSQTESFLSLPNAALVYDAVWSLALALNRTASLVNTPREEVLRLTGCERLLVGDLVPLENFTYSNGLMGCVIRWSLQQTDFIGVSGHVMFDSNGSRVPPNARVFQYRSPPSQPSVGLVHIGFASTNTSSRELTYLDGESDSTIFPGGVPLSNVGMTIRGGAYMVMITSFMSVLITVKTH